MGEPVLNLLAFSILKTYWDVMFCTLFNCILGACTLVCWVMKLERHGASNSVGYPPLPALSLTLLELMSWWGYFHSGGVDYTHLIIHKFTHTHRMYWNCDFKSCFEVRNYVLKSRFQCILWVCKLVCNMMCSSIYPFHFAWFSLTNNIHISLDYMIIGDLIGYYYHSKPLIR